MVLARVILATLLLTAVHLADARAAFPGRNGEMTVTRFDRTREGTVDTIVTLRGGRDVVLAGPDALSPRFSADGGRIVFVRRQDDRYVIAIMRADGSQQCDVPLPFSAVEPSWAPDGRSLLVTRARGGQLERRDIFRVRPDGSGLTPLIPNALEAVWAPDAGRIAYVTIAGDGCRRLALARPDGTQRKVIAGRREQRAGCKAPNVPKTLSDPGAALMPDWRPDGRRIVYASAHRVLELDLVTHRVRTLVRRAPTRFSPEYVIWPSYSPDGRSLAYAAGPYGRWLAFTVPVAGKGRTSLGAGGFPTWQPLPR